MDQRILLRLGLTWLIPTVNPTIAEASAILWAIQLAYLERGKKFIVESDAKNCVDALLGFQGPAIGTLMLFVIMLRDYH